MVQGGSEVEEVGAVTAGVCPFQKVGKKSGGRVDAVVKPQRC